MEEAISICERNRSTTNLSLATEVVMVHRPGASWTPADHVVAGSGSSTNVSPVEPAAADLGSGASSTQYGPHESGESVYGGMT